MQFNFGTGNRTPENAKRDVLDAMVDAANGRPLPGRWGLVQALSNIWATPPESNKTIYKVLWATKATLASFGVLRAYQDSKKPTTQSKIDPFVEFCEQENLISQHELSQLGELILKASKNTTPYTDLDLREEPTSKIRKFTPAMGPAFYFKIITRTNIDAEEYPSAGPFFAKGFEKIGFHIIQDILWSQFKSQTIRLTSQEILYGNYVLDLSDAGVPDVYISDPQSEGWSNATVYAKRCKLFMHRGFVRGLLFYGPPGTGKTSMAMNILGGSERILKITAAAINRSDFSQIARLIDVLCPQIILFDDIDRFGSGDLSSMLEYMENLKKNPPPKGRIIVGTVNAIQALDPALLRAGRFDEVLEVLEPSESQRKAIIQHYIQFFGNYALSLNILELTEKMQGFSPADIRSVIETISCVGEEHLDVEIQRTSRQRELFTGDKIQQYLQKTKPTNVITHY